MKTLVVLISFFALLSCNQERLENHYQPIDQELYSKVLVLDSIFFTAYNNCDLELQASIYSDSIEFFHDQGGLMTSKEEILQGTKDYICGKVQRELLKETVEVYPIANYGAVEIGMHQFINNENNEPPHPSKFIAMWQETKDGWKLAKVVSLH